MLDLAAIRSLAAEEGLAEIEFSTASRVVAFATKAGSRINVWHTTGTVGTYLEHPRQGHTQLFHRTVNLGTLRDIFRNPRAHQTGLGYHFKHDVERAHNFSSGKRSESRSRSRESRRQARGGNATAASSSSTSDVLVETEETAADEETAAKAQLEKLKKDRDDLDKEIAAVQAILDDLEKRKDDEEKQKKEQEENRERQQRPRDEVACKEDKEVERLRLGKQMKIWTGDKDTEREFLGEWYACHSGLDIDISCVGLADDATYVLVYKHEHDEHGIRPFVGRGLPSTLLDFLRGHHSGASQPTARYIALGSANRYYCELQNNEKKWHGPQSLTDELQTSATRQVRSLSFGEEWETWFIVYADGSWKCAGYVPAELTKLISKHRGGQQDLECVSLGPKDSYFLRAGNGRRWLKTANKAISEELQKIGQGRLRSVLFGKDPGTCFVRGNW